VAWAGSDPGLMGLELARAAWIGEWARFGIFDFHGIIFSRGEDKTGRPIEGHGQVSIPKGRDRDLPMAPNAVN
jgi:hypothetical protein